MNINEFLENNYEQLSKLKVMKLFLQVLSKGSFEETKKTISIIEKHNDLNDFYLNIFFKKLVTEDDVLHLLDFLTTYKSHLKEKQIKYIFNKVMASEDLDLIIKMSSKLNNEGKEKIIDILITKNNKTGVIEFATSNLSELNYESISKVLQVLSTMNDVGYWVYNLRRWHGIIDQEHEKELFDMILGTDDTYYIIHACRVLKMDLKEMKEELEKTKDQKVIDEFNSLTSPWSEITEKPKVRKREIEENTN